MYQELNNIPDELKKTNQWINFKLQKRVLQTGETKNTKPPVDYKGQNIDITNKNNYLSFEDAVDNLKNKNIAGIGFVFSSELGVDSYVGIDLDNVIINGEFTPLAKEILDLINSYSEMSVSKTGIHIITKGKIKKNGSRIGVGDSKIEVYRNNAYFTFSGLHIPNTPIEIKNRQDELKTLYEMYFRATKTGTQEGSFNLRPSISLKLSSQDNMTYLENGIKHGKRLNSFLQGYRATSDESQNDYLLMVELAYWCNKDIALMINTFYSSTYFASKNNEHKKKALRSDYINSTAKKAIQNTNQTAKEREIKKNWN